jgi:hypothetical protein
MHTPYGEVIHVVQDWSRYQLPGHHILSPPSKESGCWDEYGETHLVVLNPVKKDGALWVHKEQDIKAACPTLAAARAALRLLEM